MFKSVNSLLFAIALVLTAALLSTVPLSAQKAPLPLGTIDPDTVHKLHSCPVGYYVGMSCFSGQVEDCPNTATIGFTYGVESFGSGNAGTVVFLVGGGGQSAFQDSDYPLAYLQQGFQVVYFTWDSDWEATDGDSGTSVKAAACRPATFLNYVDQNLHAEGAMCAQALSAGAGAAAYSLAWYGAGSYLDNVEMLSGPVFGDIEQGCMVPNPAKMTVCEFGQLGCDGEPWFDPPPYVNGDPALVGRWSGQPSCNNAQRKNTSQLANELWKQMSIVDGTNNPSFDYPQTSMAAWLCSSDDSQQNNSAAEGNFFYQQFTSFGQTAGYSVTRIDHCNGPEDVSMGVTPQGQSGFTAISSHMLSACINRHNRKHSE
jgi:hypothetical protein